MGANIPNSPNVKDEEPISEKELNSALNKYISEFLMRFKDTETHLKLSRITMNDTNGKIDLTEYLVDGQESNLLGTTGHKISQLVADMRNADPNSSLRRLEVQLWKKDTKFNVFQDSIDELAKTGTPEASIVIVNSFPYDASTPPSVTITKPDGQYIIRYAEETKIVVLIGPKETDIAPVTDLNATFSRFLSDL